MAESKCSKWDENLRVLKQKLGRGDVGHYYNCDKIGKQGAHLCVGDQTRFGVTCFEFRLEKRHLLVDCRRLSSEKDNAERQKMIALSAMADVELTEREIIRTGAIRREK